jgi:hypothetical protein
MEWDHRPSIPWHSSSKAAEPASGFHRLYLITLQQSRVHSLLIGRNIFLITIISPKVFQLSSKGY